MTERDAQLADRAASTEPSPPATVRQIITTAIGYWEPRRVLYNVVLAAIVLGYFYSAWPASRERLTSDNLFSLLVLAVLANLCYCSAYIVDLFAQFSDYRSGWLRWRWLLLLMGLILATAITRFFILEMLFASGGD